MPTPEDPGFDPDEVTPTADTFGPPPPPPNPLSFNEREYLFGKFEFEPDPVKYNPEHIRILGDWAATNLVVVPLPLIGDGVVRHARVHRLIAAQFVGFWKAVEDQGLLRLVLTFDGAYAPRYKRGRAIDHLTGQPSGPEMLSNHAHGSAFDINARWNPLGTQGATLGQPGSTRRLIPLAMRFGFINGLQFHARQDPQHFEAFQVLR